METTREYHLTMKAQRFLYGTQVSGCCKSKTLLVRSRDGGLVSENCLHCGRPAYIRLENLPILDCDFCCSPLKAKRDTTSSYVYHCEQCARVWKLADTVPHWSELFQYSGLAAHGDAVMMR